MPLEKTKLIGFRVPAILHRRLRIRAGQEERTIQEVAKSALENYLAPRPATPKTPSQIDPTT